MNIKKVDDKQRLTVMSAPLYWRWSGNQRNEQMVQEIEQIIEQETENEEKEAGQEETEVSGRSEDAATLVKAEVIGLIEIEALGIKYAVLEGAGPYDNSVKDQGGRKGADASDL